MARRSADPRQLDLQFFRVPPPAELAAVDGRDFALAVRETLADVLADAKSRTDGRLDRYAVAAALSRVSGRDVSKHMLDRFCAPSADDWRFPLELVPALTKVTGDFRLLELVAGVCGCQLLHGEEAALAEYGAQQLSLKHARKRLAELEASIPESVLSRLRGEGGGE